MAIASAVLEHLVSQVKCKTLFITHYPLVATSLVRRYPTLVDNVHMAFQEYLRNDGVTEITFLYEVSFSLLVTMWSLRSAQIKNGLAPRSFGVECGRLAGLPEFVLQSATERSAKLKEQVERRVEANK